MKISLEWLNEFVDISDLTTEQIVHELTMSGLEVEDIEITGPKFTNIITAKIIKISQHPNADKLHLVEVDLGNNNKKIVVCGAQNIQEGQIIPYASVGSKVLNRKNGEQFELTPAIIRGIESQGMLCSQDELGLSGMQEEDGILILNKIFDNIQLGTKLEELLNIQKDTIIDVSPTANRGDEMSVIGVAREISSLFNKKLKCIQINEYDKKLNDFKVEIIAKDACTYYGAAALKDLVIKKSPDWMKRRLEASGIRSINNVVDITNYILLEYGQPLHAFDLDKLNGYIGVRHANEGETIVTLDGVERKLTYDTILCATKEKGVCVAGVFGGINSGIDDNTKNILLEAAYFTPPSNRKNSRSIGYRSEACARFERGVDIEQVKPALFRAVDLMIKYADAKFEGIAQAGNNQPENVEITLRFAQIKRMLGIQIPSEKCIEILNNLGFELLGRNDAAAKFKTPSFRVNDVRQEVDLIEEISRIYGFDKITPTLPNKTQSPNILNQEKLLNNINKLFLGYGFNESITSSLIGEPLLNRFGLSYNKEEAVFVKNPQSDEHTMLRQTTIANLLDTLKYNFDNGQKNIWLYEIGKTYFIKKPADKINSGVEENQILSGVMTGDANENLWKYNIPSDFYTLKGYLESLFSLLNIAGRIKLNSADNCSWLHPGRSAKIVLLGKIPETIGYFGEIYPILKDKMKINQDVYLFELNLGKLINAANINTVKYKPIPVFGEVQRDISFAIEKNITNEQILLAIKKSSNSKLFKGANLFDIYEGEHIQEGYKSLAYRITLQNQEATLTEEIINNEISSIKSGLVKKFPAINFR